MVLELLLLRVQVGLGTLLLLVVDFELPFVVGDSVFQLFGLLLGGSDGLLNLLERGQGSCLVGDGLLDGLLAGFDVLGKFLLRAEQLINR
jgi:hypothetical protein